METFLNIVIPPLAGALTYSIPKELVHDIQVGSRVLVPLGASRKASGFVISMDPPEVLPQKIKPIYALDEPEPCFLPEQVAFFQWVADYYGEPISNVIDAAIPHSIAPKKEKYILLAETKGAKVTGSLQKKILQLLTERGGVILQKDLVTELPGAPAAIAGLLKKGAIKTESRTLAGTREQAAPAWAKTKVALSELQLHALRKITSCIDSSISENFLLHGVTGSGKTEVYIEAIRHAIQQGKGAVVIVPEIALTPQLVSRFLARLGDSVAVLHSALSRRSRWEAWNDLRTGRKQVAIGARSAIFAPVSNIGIVIVDEEHDQSFKQHEGLRYNARDIALVRAKLAKSPAVLGSATPSLESFLNAQLKKITFLPLPVRHESGSPISVNVVDMNQLKPWEMPSRNISPLLAAALKETLEKGEQAFLLYNRRGFANYLQCDSCESVITCPNCSVTLTYHQFNNSLVCHYCFLKAVPPTLCTTCTLEKKEPPGTYVQRGSGTEKTQEEVQALFPHARVLRLDRDVVSSLESYEVILQAVRNRECDILVGTQMIAKGHDLPSVTLGAVIDCDVGIHMPDFRAGEKVFQLLTQLAGRTGRGDIPGKVILQTRVPNHPSIIHASRNSFHDFAKQELRSRKELRYPPFVRLLRITFSGKEEDLLIATTTKARKLIDHFNSLKGDPCTVLGPAPCPIARLKTDLRWHILIKAAKPSILVQLSAFVKEHLRQKKTLRVTCDLDPYDML